MMNWDDLRYFLAVARFGSHKGAGRSLDVDPTTVARRISALESSLPAKLFVRTPERLELTDAGRTLFSRAERVQTEILTCEREAANTDPHLNGPLRVTAADGFINYLLLPTLDVLRGEHPGLLLELRAEARVLDLSRREADVAIRLGRPREVSLVARRLGNVHFGIYGSARYLERRGLPRNVAALAAHDFIGFDASMDAIPQIKWLHSLVPKTRYVLRTNNTATQAAAAVWGHGLVLLPTYVARGEPQLKHVLPRLPCATRDLYGVTHADLKDHARVKAFLQFVTQLLGRTPDMQAGATRA